MPFKAVLMGSLAPLSLQNMYFDWFSFSFHVVGLVPIFLKSVVLPQLANNLIVLVMLVVYLPRTPKSVYYLPYIDRAVQMYFHLHKETQKIKAYSMIGLQQN